MGEYSHGGQLGELSDALRRAKRGHPGRRKCALVGATLLAAGGLLAGGLALADSGGVPPHEERVAYLLREHPDTRFQMDYAPDFVLARGWITERVDACGIIHPPR